MPERYKPKEGLQKSGIHESRYHFAGNYIKDKRVADIACGTGYGSKILSDNGAKQVTGIDIDKQAIHYAKEYFKSSNIQFLVGNALNIPLEDQTQNAVISLETIEHLKQQEAFVQEAARILKKGGIFIVSTPNPQFSSPIPFLPPGNPFHEKELTKPQLRRLLQKHFTNLDWFGQAGFIQKNRLFKDKMYCIALQILGILPDQLSDSIRNIFKNNKQDSRTNQQQEHSDSGVNNAASAVQPLNQMSYYRYIVVVAERK